MRIHAFGYDATWKAKQASTLTIHDFGQALLADVRNSPRLNCNDGINTPIVLVGHSMGGLVAKKMLILAKQDPPCHSIADRIHTMFFLATPHRGANLATTLSNVLKLAVGHGSKAYVDNLYPNSEAIQTINDQFRHVYQGKQLYSFFETVPTPLGLIVERPSGVLDLPGEQVSHLNADHSQLCKYDSPSDTNYMRLRDAFVASITLIERTHLATRMHKRQDDVERLALFLGLTERPEADYASIIEHQSEGSCTWLTDKVNFQQWLHVAKFDTDEDDFHETDNYYWLRAEPATGKSTLAAHVVQYLETSNLDCAYFFFKHLHTGKSTVAELLCSLALQMASANATIRNQLLEMCKDNTSNLEKKDERAIWRTLFMARILRVEMQQPQYWVIDGLDECANPTSLFPLLAKVDKTVPLRVFITSRPSLTFERAFSRENLSRTAESITLDMTLSDIKIYLEQQSVYFLVEGEEERQGLVKRILFMSNGNFLWTVLVVKRIEHAMSKGQIEAILRSVPKEIDALYRDITTTIMTSQETAPIARCILRWVLCSLRPLSVYELREAIRLDIGEDLPQLEKTVGSICGNLLYVDNDLRVRAAHQTVREFFFSLSKSDFMHAMSRGEEHTRITDVCLAYLRGDNMKAPRFRRTGSSRAHHNKEKRSAFSAYAIAHFSDHIAHATSANGAQLASLNDFLMKHSLVWIEAVARTSDLGPLIKTAENLRVYLDRRAKYESPLSIEVQNVKTWVNDLVFLVAQFGRTLRENPATIHHLIPAVCPRKSFIFTSFKSHARGLQVVGLEQDDWDERLCCIVANKTQILSVACQDIKFALGMSNGKVQIYSESTLQGLNQLAHGEPVRRLCFPSVHDYLISAGKKQIKYWNTTNGKLLWTLRTRDEAIALAFGDNDRTLYVAVRAGCVLIVDTQSGVERNQFTFSDWDESEHNENKRQQPPMHADFIVALGLLGVTYRQRPVNIWDLEEHEFVGQFKRSRGGHSEPYVHAFLFNPNPDINLAAVSYQDGTTYVFDPEVQKTQATAETDGSVLAVSPDGTVLAVGTGNGLIQLYDFETMKLLHQIFLHQEAIRALTFNSSGQRFFEIRGSYCNVWAPSALVRQTRHNALEDDSSADVSDQVSRAAAESSVPRTFDEERTIVAIAAHHASEYVFCGRENGSVAAYSTKTGKVVQEIFVQSQNVAVDFLDWNEHQNILISADRSGRFVVQKVSSPGSSGSPFQVGEALIDESTTAAIVQILACRKGRSILISTTEYDVLWNLTTRECVQRWEHSDQPWPPSTWATNPEKDELLFFEGQTFRAIDLYGSGSSNECRNLSGGLPEEHQVTGLVLPTQCRYGCLMASNGPHGTPSFHLLPAKAFDSTFTGKSMPHSTLLSVIKDLKAVIGIYRSWLVYLQYSGWVCSVNIDTAVHDGYYVRHFLIPLHWHGTSVSPMLVTQKGSVVMAVNEEIAVFHNGLDFEEKVLDK